jgi:uncharacterized membrane protein YeaQ/YmgE (transglycosylase-associated protein family)
MNKNKLIGIVVWAITLFGPMAQWMFTEDLGSGMGYLAYFVATIAGTFVGGYFFSKKENVAA